jgi:hypothetical protein
VSGFGDGTFDTQRDGSYDGHDGYDGTDPSPDGFGSGDHLQ